MRRTRLTDPEPPSHARRTRLSDPEPRRAPAEAAAPGGSGASSLHCPPGRSTIYGVPLGRPGGLQEGHSHAQSDGHQPALEASALTASLHSSIGAADFSMISLDREEAFLAREARLAAREQDAREHEARLDAREQHARDREAAQTDAANDMQRRFSEKEERFSEKEERFSVKEERHDGRVDALRLEEVRVREHEADLQGREVDLRGLQAALRDQEERIQNEKRSLAEMKVQLSEARRESVLQPKPNPFGWRDTRGSRGGKENALLRQLDDQSLQMQAIKHSDGTWASCGDENPSVLTTEVRGSPMMPRSWCNSK